MTLPFTPMSDHERVRFEAHYLSYLRAREGMPDLGARTLSRREEAKAAPSGPVYRDPRLDPAVFARNLDRCEPEPGVGRAMLWALAVAKGNRAERLGVETKLDRKGFEADGADDILTYVELQECYHTKTLLHVLSLVGLDTEVGPPVGALTQAGIRFMALAPRPVLEVMALGFEVVGVSAFAALRDEARELFAHVPETAARIDALLSDLLVDEVGHVHYLRARLGTRRLALSRALLPFARKALFNDNHEIRMILDRRGGARDLVHLDVDGMVADDSGALPALVA